MVAKIGPDSLDHTIWTKSGPNLDTIWTGFLKMGANILGKILHLRTRGLICDFSKIAKMGDLVKHQTPPPTPHSSDPELRTMALELTNEVQRRIKIVSLVLLLIVYHNSLCGPCLFLLRSLLVLPSASPWRRLLLTSGNDNSSFLLVTGLTQEAFNMLLEHLFDMQCHWRCQTYRRKRRGGPPLLAHEDQLGLILFNFGSTMQMKFL